MNYLIHPSNCKQKDKLDFIIENLRKLILTILAISFLV